MRFLFFNSPYTRQLLFFCLLGIALGLLNYGVLADDFGPVNFDSPSTAPAPPPEDQAPTQSNPSSFEAENSARTQIAEAVKNWAQLAVAEMFVKKMEKQLWNWISNTETVEALSTDDQTDAEFAYAASGWVQLPGSSAAVDDFDKWAGPGASANQAAWQDADDLDGP